MAPMAMSTTTTGTTTMLFGVWAAELGSKGPGRYSI